MARQVSLSLLMGVVILLAGASAHGLDIVKDGKPSCTIVVPDDKPRWDTVAAGWVQGYVQEATGARLPIVSEKDAPAGTIISIGRTKMAKAAGITTDDLKHDGCKLIVRGRVLYLIGRETPNPEPKRKSMWRAGAKGTCRAVTKFLEDVLGVRWLVNAPEGKYVPKTRDVVVSDTLSTRFSPAFAFVIGRILYGGPATIANNTRTSVSVLTYGGHSYNEWVPTEKYFKTHPEYFALIDGKRVGAGNHLCTSNPEVRELLKRGLFSDFDKGYEWVQLMQEDGYQRCQCPKCEALD